MNYSLRGNLRGFYCGDCFDFFYNATIKVYSTEASAVTTQLALANAKETFHQRTPKELKAISKKLLFETTTDENGNFEVLIGDKQKYNGGAFEIDFECGTVPTRLGPRNPPKPHGSVQFHITTLQPFWKESANGNREQSAYWEYGIPDKFWCWLLKIFGWYVVCGRVETCSTKVALTGVKVKAFDVDLIQDDFLGEAVTDSSGHFKIYYTEVDFSKTIFSWLNIEWPAGPDLFFSVEQLNGNILLQEPRSKGHSRGRENASNCTCVELCIDTNIPPEQPVPVPAFLRIGGIDYETQVQSHVGESGLTNSNYAFYKSLRLNGILSQTFGGSPMEYCFEYTRQYDGAGMPVNWVRVSPAQAGQTNIGYVEKATLMPPDISHPVPWYQYNNANCLVSSTPVAAPDIQISIAADGWILVPQQNDNPFNAAGVGLFVSNGNQLLVDSASFDAFAPVDLSGLVAGNSSTSTGKPLGADEVFALRMLVRKQGNNATTTEAGRCTRTAINNTKYDGINHHPEWGPEPIVSEPGVNMLDILQLQMAGCSKITSQVDILYTCAHPNLGSIEARLKGPLGTTVLPVPPVTPDTAGTITHLFAAADPLCAYIVTLKSTFLLTTGDSVEPQAIDQVAFCR